MRHLYGVYNPYFVRGDLNDDGILDFVMAFVRRDSSPVDAMVLDRRLLGQGGCGRRRSLRAGDVPRARHHARGGRPLDRPRRRRDHAGSGRRHDAPLSLGPGAPLLRVRARRRARRRNAGPLADVGSFPSTPPNSGAAPPRAVRVALPLPIRREFSYRVPPALEPPKPGVRVRVPFAERALTGVVMGPAPEENGKATREILAALDLEPVCSPELLATAARVAERFFASTGEVLKSALPARLPAAGAVRYRITERGALARGEGAERRILERLADGDAVRVTDLPIDGRQEALRALEQRGWIRPVAAGGGATAPGRARLRSRSARRGGSGAASRAQPPERRRARLSPGARPARHGIGDPRRDRDRRTRSCARWRRRAFSSPSSSGARKTAGSPRSAIAGPPSIRLTAEQEESARAICDAIRSRRYLAALLQGVTGSGKTEVYLRGIAAALEVGPGRDLARSGDRADAVLRAPAPAPVRAAGGRPALGTLRAGARPRLGARRGRGGAGRDRAAFGGVRAGGRSGTLRRRRGARCVLQAARVAAVRRPGSRGDPRPRGRCGARSSARPRLRSRRTTPRARGGSPSFA